MKQSLQSILVTGLQNSSPSLRSLLNMLIPAMLERSAGYLSLGTSGQYLQGSWVMGGHGHQPEEPPQGTRKPQWSPGIACRSWELLLRLRGRGVQCDCGDCRQEKASPSAEPREQNFGNLSGFQWGMGPERCEALRGAAGTSRGVARRPFCVPKEVVGAGGVHPRSAGWQRHCSPPGQRCRSPTHRTATALPPHARLPAGPAAKALCLPAR